MIGKILPALLAMFAPAPAVVRRWARGNRYLPHQGKRECARRVRQMQAGALQFRA